MSKDKLQIYVRNINDEALIKLYTEPVDYTIEQIDDYFVVFIHVDFIYGNQKNGWILLYI